MHAGWSSIKTLETHKYVFRSNCRAELEDGRWTSDLHHFSVTGEGREFTNEMIAKYGSDDPGIDVVSIPGSRTGPKRIQYRSNTVPKRVQIGSEMGLNRVQHRCNTGP